MTHDNGMDSSPSWQEIKTERDDIAQDVIQLMHLLADIRAAVGDPEGKLMQPELVARIQEMREDRDALAAHLERWKDWLGQDAEDDVGDWMDQGWAIAQGTPAASLARRDLLKQAEALEEASDDCVAAMHKMAHWLRARAEECRCQTEESR